MGSGVLGIFTSFLVADGAPLNSRIGQTPPRLRDPVNELDDIGIEHGRQLRPLYKREPAAAESGLAAI